MKTLFPYLGMNNEPSELQAFAARQAMRAAGRPFQEMFSIFPSTRKKTHLANVKKISKESNLI
jgi:hypothetical protein